MSASQEQPVLLWMTQVEHVTNIMTIFKIIPIYLFEWKYCFKQIPYVCNLLKYNKF